MKLAPSRPCSNCRTNPVRAAGQYYCASCHAWYTRQRRKLWRPRPKPSDDEKVKKAARSAARRAFRAGKIKSPRKLLCQRARCANLWDALHHHRGYSWAERLSVEFLCVAHHAEAHGATYYGSNLWKGAESYGW